MHNHLIEMAKSQVLVSIAGQGLLNQMCKWKQVLSRLSRQDQWSCWLYD
jgi:hypothetical protein